MTLEDMKARKKELGYSNKEISERSGVPFGTVQKIFGGKTISPRHETIAALENVLKPTAPHPENPVVYYSTSAASTPSYVAEAPGTYGTAVGRQTQPGNHTVEDWENLPGDVRAELIHGELRFMAAPIIVHQEFVSILTREFGNYIHSHHGSCRVFPAPCGVRLFRDNATIVEPDISILCHRDQITRKWMDGAPDLVVEVLSPASRKYDMVEKLELYKDAGVKEYWIIDPSYKRVYVYIFDDPALLHLYTFQDKIPVGIWKKECIIDFSEISKEIAYLADDKGNF